MGYPDYPNNRLIVNDVDLTANFKMVLVDGYTLEPPEPKTYTIDIPGGNGVLDLTETLLGDTAYNNRKQEFTFYVINTTEFEAIKTRVSNFLHGRSYNYKITMDPDYTYTGRFSVTSYTHSAYASGITGIIKISIDAKPFKMKPQQTYKVDAVGGKLVYLPSGRMRVRPTIDTNRRVRVEYNNKVIYLTNGAWTLNDLMFSEGLNEIYFNAYDIRNLTWGDLKTNSVTWDEFGTQRIFEWYRSNGDGTYVMNRWKDVADKTWADLSGQTWADQSQIQDVNVVRNVYINYDWGDL